MNLCKYQFHCTTCAADKVLWLPEDTPIACPVDPAHTVDQDSIEVLRHVGPMAEINEHGKLETIAESRPPGTFTVFTSRGDSPAGLFDGPALAWDFSTPDGEVAAPAGFRRKRIDLTFHDPVWLKEGAIYHLGALHGSWCSLAVVCPAGQAYLDRAGNPVAADEDTVVFQFVPCHFFSGDAPMGDELNTEGCTREPIPAGWIFRAEITVPAADQSSTGHVTLELYRERTCLLPGEAV